MAEALDSFRKSIDSARGTIVTNTTKSYETAKEGLASSNPYMYDKVNAAEAVVKGVTTDFEKLGFWESYKDYNLTLLKPFKPAETPLTKQVLGSLTLKPENPIETFVLWNVLCFWLGVVDCVLLFLTSSSLVLTALVVAIADGLTGYFFAYLFYFLFVVNKDKKMWMQTGAVLLTLYVLIVIYLAYVQALAVNIPEVILNILKALFNTVVGYQAWLIWKATPTEMV